jgi:putative ABC transport system substrate-binding protein
MDGVFARLTRGDVNGLITLADPFFTAQWDQLVKLALSAQLPTMFHWREFVQAGGLMLYGPDNVAHFVNKVLKGAKPETLAIEQPTSFALYINLKTAQALGIAIRPELLTRADEVME